MSEKARDCGRLDRAIDECMKLIEAQVEEGQDATYADAMRLQAADRLVKLLERRSKLLGLDAEPGQSSQQGGAETPVDRIKRMGALAVVPKQGGT